MYRREVALPSNSVGPGKSSAITTSFPFRSMPLEFLCENSKEIGIDIEQVLQKI
jgi:hypothetical protein